MAPPKENWEKYDKPVDDKEENIVALDEGDIALLKTYGQGPYAKDLKKLENDIRDAQKRVNEKIGVKESDTGLAPPALWDIPADKQRMGEEQPLQVARCTKIIEAVGDEPAKYVINVKQIAKFVVGLGEKVSPTDIDEGIRVGVDRTKYHIQIPLPPKIDASVTMMQVEEKPDVTYSDVGGCKEQIEKLREVVELPLLQPERFVNLGIDPPKGVLLYGPPGCGKTMLAKALAKESGATFINMHVSTLTDKWFGESNKLVAALFSLAHKMQPAIIFIDEIDSFLRERRSNDHEITSMMKAEFMSMWDGLTTGEDTRIIVLGATNRPNDIDSAILRRMPKRFAIKLPSEEQRMNILKLMLGTTKIDPNFDYQKLVQKTAGFSGSDLKEACRNASMLPLREYLRGKGSDKKGALEGVILDRDEVRALRLSDFFQHEANEESSSHVILEQESVD